MKLKLKNWFATHLDHLNQKLKATFSPPFQFAF